MDKGTEIEMPSLANNSLESVNQLIADGTLTQEEADAQVDEALRRILRAYGYAGYRWYDANGIEPQFDFGYGLSYTTFEYSDLAVTFAPAANETAGFDVTFTVTNTGDVTGSEVAQLYLGEAQLPEGLQSAKVQLAGYEKVRDLEPGESREVTLHVSERALSYWNANQEELTEREDGTKGSGPSPRAPARSTSARPPTT